MKHRAQQFEMTGQELIFNLAGEILREEPPASREQPRPDNTQEMFPEPKNEKETTK